MTMRKMNIKAVNQRIGGGMLRGYLNSGQEALLDLFSKKLKTKGQFRFEEIVELYKAYVLKRQDSDESTINRNARCWLIRTLGMFTLTGMLIVTTTKQIEHKKE